MVCSVLCLLCLCSSVYMCFVVTCWERADLLALVCGVFCEFVYINVAQISDFDIREQRFNNIIITSVMCTCSK